MLKQHPLSCAFPAMSAEDFQALKDDIEVNGQREPIIVLDGMVLDGWHRYRACLDLSIKPAQFTFKEGDDPVAFVESANLHRRHLTATQRAEAVIAVRAWAPAKRPAARADADGGAINLGKGAAAAPLSTNKGMAKAANVSVRTIKDAKAGHKAGLGELMKDGVLTAEQAGNIARGKPAVTPKPTQAPKRAPWEKTPAPTNAPTTADDAFDGFDPIAELEATQKRLEEAEKRIESLTADDTTAELNKQIGIRQGIEARLSLEMSKVAQLQKELDAYGRWFAELRKASGMEKRSEITRLVREAANARSAAV